MTNKVTVIVKADLDKQTVNISDENKVGSMFLLTPQEVTIPANQIQGLIFRKAKNSNYPMFCTGFQYNSEWYGDRPDDGIWVNPFENMQKYQRTGNDNVEYVAPTPTKNLKFSIVETYQGVHVRVENSTYTTDNPPPIKAILYNGGNNLGTPSWVEDNGALVWQSSSTVLSFTQDVSVQVDFTNGRQYQGTIERTSNNGGAGTYTLEAPSQGMGLESLLTSKGFMVMA